MKLRATTTLLLLISAALGLLAPVNHATAAPSLDEYSMVFSDEFDTLQLDSQKWSTAPIWGPYVTINAEQQYYVDTLGINSEASYDPFTLNGSTLTISAQSVEDVGLPPVQPAQNASIWNNYPEYNYHPDYNRESADYQSGIITSVNSFNFTHGYIETRAKVPAGRGLWPAFWLLTSKYVEDVPEIDIMEALGQNTDEVYHTLHYFDTTDDWQLISSPTYKTEGQDFTQDFHSYGLLWSPKAVAWYVDGVEVKRVTDAEFLIAKQSMYLLANLAVGGNWPGAPDENTTFPADYEIDYIRVYQKTPPEIVTPAVLQANYQLMFEDNFNPLPSSVDIFGTGLHPDRWNTQYLWGPYFRINNENQVYIDQHGRHQNNSINPFSVITDGDGNGLLKITATAVNNEDLPNQPAAGDAEWALYPSNQYNLDYQVPGGWNPGAASGLITTYDSFKFVNGYAEIRAKLPAGEGLWPALWLLNGYYVGPQPEIDIAEMQGEDPATIYQSYHYSDSSGSLINSVDTASSPGVVYSEDFHTYAVQWDKGRIQWYIDGELTRVLSGPQVSTQLMYVLINLAVGGNFVGYDGLAALPAEMLVDYVRVYQLDGVEASAPPSADPMYREAESASLFGAMVTDNDETASEGAFVHVPVDSGSVPAYADFNFTIDQDGLYYLEAAVSADSGQQNSFYVSVNSAQNFTWDLPVSETFKNDVISSRGNGNWAHELSAGEQSVRISRRENGARIDWMRITLLDPQGDLDDDGFVNAVDVFPLNPSEWTDSDNDGLGNNMDPTPYGTEQPLHAEAETATLFGAMSQQSDSLASGGTYVTAPIGTSSGEADYIQFDFKVNDAGNYKIDAGVYASSSNSDSFFVTINDGSVFTWDIPRTGNYVNDTVSNRGVGDLEFNLDLGVNTVKVFRRENGARLDWLALVFTGSPMDDDGDGFTNARDAFPADPAEWTDSDSDGTGNNMDPTPYGDVTPLRAEAELATLRGQMIAIPDTESSNGSYVAVPVGNESNNYESDSVEFEFKITVPGQYKMEASVFATGGLDNSFYVSVNNCEYMIWDLPATSAYTVDTVSSRNIGDLIYQLSEGTLHVRIVKRESGARLDNLELVLVSPDN